jgi:hypothetical protein
LYFTVSSQMLLDKFLKNPREESLARIVSRMTAKDGIPFLTFCTSADLRRSIGALGLPDQLPKSSATIRKMVTNYANLERAKQIIEVKSLKKSGSKFCVIFDEWTSRRNRRYMNIILKSDNNKMWNLGLVPIKGSLTSEKFLNLVVEKIEQYHLKFVEDVVCIVTDGTSVMTKIGKLTKVLQQVYFVKYIISICII